MKISSYLKDKINYLLAFVMICLIWVLYANAMQVDPNVIFFTVLLFSLFVGISFLIHFSKKNQKIKRLNQVLDHLQEKYLISEVMEKPKRAEALAYYKILKRITKSMLEQVNKTQTTQKEYKEYIESWVHEIKIPITSIKLYCENNKSEMANKIEEDVEEINNYVEQVLFYARLDQVSNDFMIREVLLEDVIRTVLARNKKWMIQNKMKVEVDHTKTIAYTDEKWLIFILNQIVINSIKYKAEENPEIQIRIEEGKENVKLIVQDNGIGIKKSELDRIFDKGFTGTNGRNQKKSTGIGLYLCKRICEELGMRIEVDSIQNQYTKMELTIPRRKPME